MGTSMVLDPVMIEIERLDACFGGRFTEVMSHCLLPGPAPVNKISTVVYDYHSLLHCFGFPN